MSESIRYVEVPVIKEEVITRSKPEFVEVEKIVPVYDYHIQERIIEVPQIEMINTEVEVERIQEVVKRVPKKEIIQVPTEVIKYVTKVVTKLVEQVVEVPGDVIQVPKPYKVENRVIVPRYINQEVPVLVNQLIQPLIQESDTESITVTVKQYDPYLVPVDVFVPLPVSRPLIPTETRNSHRIVDVPPSQFNALVKSVNAGATDQDVDGLLAKHLDGSIPMLTLGPVMAPRGNDWKQSVSEEDRSRLHIQTTPGQSFLYPNISKQTIVPAP